MAGQRKHGILGGIAHVAQPLARHPVAQQTILGDIGKQSRLRRRRALLLHVLRDDNLTHRLADFHKLRRASLRVGFQPPPLRPLVGFVVVIDVAQQEAAPRPVNDQPDIQAHPHRPEVGIFGLVELVELEPRLRRVQLEIEGRRLHRLLLIAGKLGEAVRKRIRNPEFHNTVRP